jgi:hypothetical protein
MAQITSREELEAWLKDKPADWAQVIAARAALRALPYGLSYHPSLLEVSSFVQVLFRTVLISWTASNYPELVLKDSANRTITEFLVTERTKYDHNISGTTFAVATYSAYAAVRAVDAANVGIAVAEAVAAATDSARVAYSGEREITWTSVAQDCERIDSEGVQLTASEDLSSKPLWWSRLPEFWTRQWYDVAVQELRSLDETYQVWIDWYNRRIEGHDAAFDIPGDIDRVHDKAILARLADASDEDFWGKGATYVNTTLQRWIDEARTEARIDEILRQLRGGATAHYGAPEELAGRAALLDELDRLLGKSPQARHGIGGNYPPEPIDAVDPPVALPEDVREPLELISGELEKREPDALVVVEQVKLLHRVGRKFEKMAGLASDEFAKSVGGELGKWIVQGAFWLTLINQFLDWLGPLIR